MSLSNQIRSILFAISRAGFFVSVSARRKMALQYHDARTTGAIIDPQRDPPSNVFKSAVLMILQSVTLFAAIASCACNDCDRQLVASLPSEWIEFQFEGQAEDATAGILVPWRGLPLSVDDVLRTGIYFNTAEELAWLKKYPLNSRSIADGSSGKILTADAQDAGLFRKRRRKIDDDNGEIPISRPLRPTMEVETFQYWIGVFNGQRVSKAGLLIPYDALSNAIEPSYFFMYGIFVPDISQIDDVTHQVGLLHPMSSSVSDSGFPLRGLKQHEVEIIRGKSGRTLVAQP